MTSNPAWLLVLLIPVMAALVWQSLSTRTAAKQSVRVGEKLLKSNAVIYTLVNSNLLAAQLGELNATRLTLIALRELASFKEVQGFAVSAETSASIETAKARVAKLENEVGYERRD